MRASSSSRVRKTALIITLIRRHARALRGVPLLLLYYLREFAALDGLVNNSRAYSTQSAEYARSRNGNGNIRTQKRMRECMLSCMRICA